MRRNQVSISITRFGDQAPDGARQQQITAYADANDVWEALCAAFYQAMGEIQKDQALPEFGRVSSHLKNIVHETAPRRRPETVPNKELQAWAEESGKLKELEKPIFISELLSWAVSSQGQLVVGRPLFVSNKFMGTPLRYRYTGYQQNQFRRMATALDLNDVLESVLYSPEKTSIEKYRDDYSAQEIALIEGVKAQMMAAK